MNPEPAPSLAHGPAPAATAPLGHPRTHSSGADILRGVAILMVIVYHCVETRYGYYLPWHGNFRDWTWKPPGVLVWYYPVTFGWAGVALFFVLSGFCIHFSCLRRPPFDARHFFRRRFWRIYPAYLVALAAFFVLGRVWREPGGVVQGLAHLLCLHNINHGLFFGIDGSFWSLAVEMQLYLLFPLLLFGRARWGIERCLLGTFALSCLWRVVAVWKWGLPDHIITPVLTLPPSTWFDWTLGAFVAERFHAGRRAFAGPAGWWIAGTLGLFVASTLYKPATVFSFSLAAAASAVLLDAALHAEWRPRPWTVALEFVGLVSYSLYLWHQPLIDPVVGFLSQFLGSIPLAWTAFALLLLVGAWMSYHLLERPGIRLGDTLWRRPGRTAIQR